MLTGANVTGELEVRGEETGSKSCDWGTEDVTGNYQQGDAGLGG